MVLQEGTTLGGFEITGLLGKGGMGEVYRAKDTRLDREVAIKVLPEHFAEDEERLRRFEREAKSLASLNHPNVAQIHGVDQVEDTCFLVLELVPGETLEERIGRGALPLDETIDVCRQIAEGLGAAHEARVVHRDLKPANVRITPEGKVTPCPYMPVVAGDLMTQSFQEIWESSPVFTQLRSGELGGKCGRCEYREVCGGCRARAYADSGDFMGPDDSCVYEPSGEIPLIASRRTVSYGQSGSEEPSVAGATAGTAAEPADSVPLEWTPEALARVDGIPSFVRGVVMARVEKFAGDRGYTCVDVEVMEEVRRNLPVDFSKKLPFFMGRGGRA